jgi:putative ATP-dependent endonuclease of OLD family
MLTLGPGRRPYPRPGRQTRDRPQLDVQGVGDRTVCRPGRVLVDDRRVHAVVTHPCHQVTRAHARLSRQGVARVAQVVEVQAHLAHALDDLGPDDPVREPRPRQIGHAVPSKPILGVATEQPLTVVCRGLSTLWFRDEGVCRACAVADVLRTDGAFQDQHFSDSIWEDMRECFRTWRTTQVKLTGIAIQKYRSIKRANRLNLGDLTVLVGPNNEGKSNILRALVLSMMMLRRYGLPGIGRTTSRLRVSPRDYDWTEDFPKSLQSRTPEGNTIIDLWFELDEVEQTEFRERIGSNLRTELPIRLTISATAVEFSVRKQGRGGVTLNRKSSRVAQFIGQALRVEYIQSVRTATRAQAVVQDMVAYELEEDTEQQQFTDALTKLVSSIEPVVNRLSGELASTLKNFLPDVSSVSIELTTEGVLEALLSKLKIIVDDGVATELKYKGDGVQSLAALALVRKAAADRRLGALLLAVEEPEAHLHPRAIHELRQVLIDIAVKQQVVLTTHTPLLVNRHRLSSNIIVRSNRAAPAKNLADLRDALGVRISDNLLSASLVLLVEGGGDEAALKEILGHKSPQLKNALVSGGLAIEQLGSASKLTSRLHELRAQLCRYHVLLDDDQAGRDAARNARTEGLLLPSEEHLVVVPGQTEAEFEDTLDPAIYKDAILTTFGVNLDVKEFKHARTKWSTRVERTFLSQGKHWDKYVKMSVKSLVGRLVCSDPTNALHSKRANSLSSLASELERRLDER